ncbi:unnamed protein product [Adineta steineri]|uniref:TH1 domain-containing protein n=1 Tax=Adineta steineri TaxID=433720 RepID=A0A814GNI8_9BILA|nr:unnamed protein product [Adineta steineri]
MSSEYIKYRIGTNDITGLSVTSGKEQLIVIHLISNPDLVFYMQTKHDRVPEFVGYIAKLKQKLSNFVANVQRYISASFGEHKYIFNIIWDCIEKVEFRKGSNNNISLMLPDTM